MLRKEASISCIYRSAGENEYEIQMNASTININTKYTDSNTAIRYL